jgi:hypothetical protein
MNAQPPREVCRHDVDERVSASLSPQGSDRIDASVIVIPAATCYKGRAAPGGHFNVICDYG